MKKVMFVVILSFMVQLFSQFGNGLAFDGADDIVDISSTITTATTTQDITVEAWIYPTSNINYRVIASKYSHGSGSASNFMITRNPDQKLFISGNGSDVITSNGIIPLNTWTHIAVVFKAGTNNTKIYISGALDISGTLNYNTINSSTNMRIGETVNIAIPYVRWSGTIDEMRLWNTARTIEQISGNMRSPLTGTETGLVALYSFNQGVAGGSNPGVTTLPDLTGHNYTGALQNFALTGTTSNWVAGYTATTSQTFTDIDSGLTGLQYGSVAWGDYDNDGDLDILLTGLTTSGSVSKIYRNDSGVFTDINAGLTGVYVSSVSWGDYDNDGDLDILLTGYTGSERISMIYRNNSGVPNTKPLAPSNLSAVQAENNLTFSWDKATDAETSQNGLSYNLYIGTTPLTGNKKSPMSNITNGYKKIVSLGNTGSKNSYTIKNLPEGAYYWSVQAVDHAFSGSAFSGERIMFIGSIYPPQNVTVSPAGSVITLTWDAVSGATSYKIFSCEEPYGAYTDISREGVFVGASWSYNYIGTRKFYYVVAVSQIKEEAQTK